MEYDWQPYLFVVESSLTRRIRSQALLIIESKSPEKFDINASRALGVEIQQVGTLGIWTVLGVIYERFFRRKGLYFSLELLDHCVRICGLKIAQHMRKHFMEAMTRLLKITSLKEQTFVGQVNSSIKKLYNLTKTKNSSLSSGTEFDSNIRDVILVRCQKKVLYLIQLWKECFAQYESRVPDIYKCHRSLTRKGFKFPTIEQDQKFEIVVDTGLHDVANKHSITYGNGMQNCSSPSNNILIVKLQQAIKVYQDPNSSINTKTEQYNFCKLNHPKLVSMIESLVERRYQNSDQINGISERKLNSILDLLIEVEDLLDDWNKKNQHGSVQNNDQVNSISTSDDQTEKIPILIPPPNSVKKTSESNTKPSEKSSTAIRDLLSFESSDSDKT